MPTAGHTEQTEQRILNDSKDAIYGTIDVTPYVETTVGSVAQRQTGTVVGSSVAADVNIVGGTATLAVNIDKDNDSILVYGSDDGGTTKRVIKTDSGGAVQVDVESGSITANAGTNLNTSLLALESGGNLSSILTSVQLIDDTVVAQGTALGSTKVSLMGGSVTTAAPTFTTGQINQLSLTTSGALRVDVGATGANATAIKVDGSGVTQPISGSVSVTSVVPGVGNTNLAKQNNSVFADVGTEVGPMVLAIDDASSRYRPLHLATDKLKTVIFGNDGATLDSTIGAGTAPTNQVVVGAVYNSTEISPTTGQAFALQADSKGRLRSVMMDAAGNSRGANINASNQLTVSVDNNPVLGAGTNAIGKLAANSGVDIGDVDVTSVVPGTGTTNLGKAVGASLAGSSVGVLMVGVENTGQSVLSGIGQITPLATDLYGGLLLSSTGPNIPTLDAADYNEDSTHSSTHTGVFILGVRNDSGATTRTNANSDYSPISVDIRGRMWVNQAFEQRSDTYTTTANGTTVTVATFPLKYFSIQVVQTGTVTAWDVRLEVSNDGTNFTQLLQHTNATGSGAMVFSVASPALYFRSRCAGLTLGVGTNVIAYITGMN